MKVIAFLQLRNEFENGNLIRCLEGCKKWSDEIFIYDDCSTDGSQTIYLKYTDKSNIIFGEKPEFNKECFHKQQLLSLALRYNPDWIGWVDGDDVFDREITENCKSILDSIPHNCNGAYLHNMNLWRHPSLYRIDNKFDDLWKVSFWRNNGQLYYRSLDGLHRPQHPINCTPFYHFPPTNHLIHYGFADKKLIVKKYLIYKSYGQQGWDLDRLIDEMTSYQLVKVPKYVYPDELVPENHDSITTPAPLTYDEYRRFNNWEEFKESEEYNKLWGES